MTDSERQSGPAKLPGSLGVIGAGSWGTALSILFARNGIDVRLWGNEPEVLKDIEDNRCNRKYLPDIEVPEKLHTVPTMEELSVCDELLVVVPSHAFHLVMEQVRDMPGSFQRLFYATKGFEPVANKLLHEVVRKIFGEAFHYAVISGPTFAIEVARGLPTALTVASNHQPFAAEIAAWMHNDRFRAYTSQDVAGVEVGGAVKNVLAIGAGISDGLGFGANSRAALITRGLHEMVRLGMALGAKEETFMGLAGMGDLVLTCTDNQSRNRRFGMALAGGKTIEAAKQEIGQVVEGAQTARVVHELAQRYNIDMPITRELYQVLYEGADPSLAVRDLFKRALKPEFD